MKDQLRVLIDGWFLRGATRGIARYTRGLVAALVEAGVQPAVIVPSGINLLSGTHLDHVLRRVAFRGPFPIWEQVVVPLAALALRVDLIHTVGNTLPLWSAVPRVATIQDLLYMNREWAQEVTLRKRLVAMYRTQVVTHGAGAAARLICTTSVTRDEVVSRLSIPRVNISIIGIGPDSGVAGTLPLARRDRNPPYVLSIAADDPRKNLMTLLRAQQLIIKSQGGGRVRLVVVGASEKVRREVADAGLSGLQGLELRSFVPDDELRRLYAGALCFVYLSRYEGFGLPIIEAQTHGTPVVVSDTPVHREVAGRGGLFVPPDHEAEVARAITSLLDEPTWELVSGTAIENASRFAWRALAPRILTAYELALS